MIIVHSTEWRRIGLIQPHFNVCSGALLGLDVTGKLS
jgi:hypothetical protein